MVELKFCPDCGSRLKRREIAKRPCNHWYCELCKEHRYDHPRVVVTCFAACENRLLWVQRDLQPQRGLWAIPGGFLESGETLAQGAARELREESAVSIPAEQLQLYMTGTITFIRQHYALTKLAMLHALPKLDSLIRFKHTVSFPYNTSFVLRSGYINLGSKFK